MTYIKLEQFSGTAPRTTPTQLTANQAQIANNARVTSKGLGAWRKETLRYVPASVATLTTIYQLTNLDTNDFRWLGWENDVDVVVGPVGDISESRIYYTGDGLPKKTNWNMATASGSTVGPYPKSWLYMGVPNPTIAPTLSASSAATPLETRAYVYTNVSQFGTVYEESGPSPATLVNVSSAGASVTISGFSAVPTTGYNITKRRIYRTITGASSTGYSFVAEIAIGVSSYIDSLTVAQLGGTLSSLYYAEPPVDLAGITAMTNGVLAGFRGNEVWFCEPYIPHAWPTKYMLTVNDDIVGLAFYSDNLVVLTKHQPFVITGAPGAMTQAKLPMFQPCVSKRSIATDQYGILYASPNGIVGIGNGTSDVVTNALYTRDEWQQLLPETIFARVYNNMYMAFCTDAAGNTAAIVLSRGDIPPLFNMDFPANAVFVEHGTGAIFAVSKIDNAIYEIDSDYYNYKYFEWLSKRFIMPSPTNFGAMKIEADFDKIADAQAHNALVAQIIARNQQVFAANNTALQGAINTQPLNKFQVNGSIMQTIPPLAGARSINVFLYADGELLHTQGVASNAPFRLPSGRKATQIEIKLTGNATVSGVVLAGTMTELREVANG